MNARTTLHRLFVLLAIACIGLLSEGRAQAHESTSDWSVELEAPSCGGELPAADVEWLEASSVDCTLSTDQGYSSGQPFDIEVVHIDGKAVELDTANAFWVMQEAAAVEGIDIRIVSGFRTYAEQEYLYGCYVNCNCNNCNLAARPGYSNHNSGHALDLNTSAAGVYDWLANNAALYGFERTVPSENWHWEWWGGGPGGGVCGVEARECPVIPDDGRTIEEDDDCFVGGGQPQYLRRVDEGHGGGLIWTKATDSGESSNYGIWRLNFKSAGRYELFAYTDGGNFGQSAQAGYLVRHAEGESLVLIDQSAMEGWQSLGVFAFDTDSEFQVRLDDNTGEAWEADPGGVKLQLDALRVVPEGTEPDDEDAGDPLGPRRGGEEGSPGDLIGGCATSGRSSGSSALLLLIGALVARRRRKL